MCPLLDTLHTYLKVNICHHLTGFNALDLKPSPDKNGRGRHMLPCGIEIRAMTH